MARKAEETWRLASPDSEANCAITIHHVSGDAIAAARAHLVEDDDGASWLEATATLRTTAVAHDASRQFGRILMGHILFDLLGRSPYVTRETSIYDPREVLDIVAALAERSELSTLIAEELAARRFRTNVPPWPADASNAPLAWLVASLRRAAEQGLGVFWEVASGADCPG